MNIGQEYKERIRVVEIRGNIKMKRGSYLAIGLERLSFGFCLRFDLAWVEMELTQCSKPSPRVGLGGQSPPEEPQLRWRCG